MRFRCNTAAAPPQGGSEPVFARLWSCGEGLLHQFHLACHNQADCVKILWFSHAAGTVSAEYQAITGTHLYR